MSKKSTDKKKELVSAASKEEFEYLSQFKKSEIIRNSKEPKKDDLGINRYELEHFLNYSYVKPEIREKIENFYKKQEIYLKKVMKK